MTQYEYKVVPAPTRAEKQRGIKGTSARFAHAMTTLLNDLAAEGWEYWRADTLPCEERSGLTGKTTQFQNLLIFRREVHEVPIWAEAMIADEDEDGAFAEDDNEVEGDEAVSDLTLPDPEPTPAPRTPFPELRPAKDTADPSKPD